MGKVRGFKIGWDDIKFIKGVYAFWNLIMINNLLAEGSDGTYLGPNDLIPRRKMYTRKMNTRNFFLPTNMCVVFAIDL